MLDVYLSIIGGVTIHYVIYAVYIGDLGRFVSQIYKVPGKRSSKGRLYGVQLCAHLHINESSLSTRALRHTVANRSIVVVSRLRRMRSNNSSGIRPRVALLRSSSEVKVMLLGKAATRLASMLNVG